MSTKRIAATYNWDKHLNTSWKEQNTTPYPTKGKKNTQHKSCFSLVSFNEMYSRSHAAVYWELSAFCGVAGSACKVLQVHSPCGYKWWGMQSSTSNLLEALQSAWP
eukprot:5459269-Amphidinium_carterae.1